MTRWLRRREKLSIVETLAEMGSVEPMSWCWWIGLSQSTNGKWHRPIKRRIDKSIVSTRYCASNTCAAHTKNGTRVALTQWEDLLRHKPKCEDETTPRTQLTAKEQWFGTDDTWMDYTKYGGEPLGAHVSLSTNWMRKGDDHRLRRRPE